MSSPGDAGKRSITSGFMRLKAGLENKRLLGLLVVERVARGFATRRARAQRDVWLNWFLVPREV